MQMQKFMKLFKLGILSFLLCEVALADSMMLSPAELAAIGVVSDNEKPQELTSLIGVNNAKIRLDGIIFQGEKDWCIWLNGQRFSCGQNPSNYKIVKVCPDCVEMVLVGESESEVAPIVLRLG